jgi:hypothetical protein
MDGYLGSCTRKIVTAQTQEDFELHVAERIAEDDGTRPEQGWPWPWEDSCTTDYAYAFDEGRVFIARFGHTWRTLAEQEAFEASDEDEPLSERCVFPNMKDRQRVTYGPRSGLIVMGIPREEP